MRPSLLGRPSTAGSASAGSADSPSRPFAATHSNPHRPVDPFVPSRVRADLPSSTYASPSTSRLRTDSSLSQPWNSAATVAAQENAAVSSVFDTSASRRLRREHADAAKPAEARLPSARLSPRASAAASSVPARDFQTVPADRSPSYWERYWKVGPTANGPSAGSAPPAPGSSLMHSSSALATTVSATTSSLSARPAAAAPAATTSFRAAEPLEAPMAAEIEKRWTTADEKLSAAAVSADVEHVKRLLADGVMPDVPDARGDTALHKAGKYTICVVL